MAGGTIERSVQYRLCSEKQGPRLGELLLELVQDDRRQCAVREVEKEVVGQLTAFCGGYFHRLVKIVGKIVVNRE